MEEDAANDHDAIIEFATYEDFLDSQISTLDLYYLEVFINLFTRHMDKLNQIICWIK
jgi:hypothetical protein